MTASGEDSEGQRDGLRRTVIVVHPKERRSKCTVEALRKHPELSFVTFPRAISVDPETYVRIGLGGPLLSLEDRDKGLLLLDGTWRRAAQMEPTFADLPVRSLPPLVTAYPRKSILFEDPQEGLATVEALYAALRITGRSVTGILDHYYWKREFLERNRWLENETF